MLLSVKLIPILGVNDPNLLSDRTGNWLIFDLPHEILLPLR